MIAVYLLQHLNAFARLGRLSPPSFPETAYFPAGADQINAETGAETWCFIIYMGQNPMQMNDNGRRNPKYTVGYISILHHDCPCFKSSHGGSSPE